MMAKYGLGPTQAITVEEIRDRLQATVQLIRRTLSVADADRILSQMKRVWS